MIKNREGEVMQLVKASYLEKLEADRLLAMKDMVETHAINEQHQATIENLRGELSAIKEFGFSPTR